MNNKILKNLRPMDYNETLEILSTASSIRPPETKKMIIVFGANGSGKSTLIANLYQNKKLNLPYINTCLILKQQFTAIQNEKERNEKAMFYTINVVNNFLETGKSFCYESVFSHPSKLEILQKAKNNGYEIILFYIETKNPEINIKRVAKRSSEGGMNIPRDKIIERYEKLKQLVPDAISFCNKFYLLDNSKERNLDGSFVEEEKFL